MKIYKFLKKKVEGIFKDESIEYQIGVFEDMCSIEKRIGELEALCKDDEKMLAKVKEVKREIKVVKEKTERYWHSWGLC